jgi:prepilin-type N-terminal cleavage/methylation domain-containing protein
MENNMRKGFTLAEVVIALVIVGILGLVLYSNTNRYSVEYRCNKAGYLKLSQMVGNKFCTRVENGNTIVIHVDSIR